jgi:hypothetical protein
VLAYLPQVVQTERARRLPPLLANAADRDTCGTGCARPMKAMGGAGRDDRVLEFVVAADCVYSVVVGSSPTGPTLTRSFSSCRATGAQVRHNLLSAASSRSRSTGTKSGPDRPQRSNSDFAYKGRDRSSHQRLRSTSNVCWSAQIVSFRHHIHQTLLSATDQSAVTPCCQFADFQLSGWCQPGVPSGRQAGLVPG